MALTVKLAQIDLQLKRFFSSGFAFAATAVLMLAPPNFANAQAQGETTPAATIGTASLLTPTQVDSYFGTATTSTNGLNLVGRSPEVVELARALAGNAAPDPANPTDSAKVVDRVYQYVLNNIEMVWVYGLQRGSVGAIVDHSGTAFDQAMLMVQLLRQAGYTANYQVGQITLSGQQFYDWSGVQNAQSACQLLSSGSIGAIINGTTDPTCASYAGTNVSTITLNHIWVAVVINGATYQFDPAFKVHLHKSGLNIQTGQTLAATAGLTAGQSLTQATSGTYATGTDGVTGLPFVKSLNETALDTTIQSYAGNVLTYVKANPQAQMVDILGGEVISRYEVPAGGLRQTSLSYSNASPAVRTWTGAVPDQYRTTLGVQQSLTHNNTGGSGFGTQQLWNVNLFVDEIYGRKLETFSTFNSLDPNYGGANFTASLALMDETGAGVAGVPINIANFSCVGVSGCSYILGDRSGTVTLTVNHPYAASANGTATTNGDYMDAVITKGVDLDVPFMIVHAWGDANGLDKQFGTRDDTVLPPPSVPTGDSGKQLGTPVGGDAGDGKRESMAAGWIVQSSKAARIHAAIASSIYQLHHSVGVVSADVLINAVDYYPGVATPPGFINNVPTVADSFTRFDIDSAFSLTSKLADPVARRAAVLAIAASTDALEGSMSAQNSDLPDTVSTATRFEWGNAPPASEDEVSAGAPRRFFTFTSANSASIPNVVKIAGLPRSTYSSGAGPYTCTGIFAVAGLPSLCNSIAAGWPDLLTTAATAYTQAGFTVTASEELRLGPGQPFGYADTFMQGQSTEYTAFSTMQRGSAFVAVRYNASGDPLQIAHVVVNTTPYGPGAGTISKGGGGGIQPDQQALWDPAKAADALKAKFVDRSTELGVDLSNGNVSYSVPAQLSIGNGDFPKKLTAQYIWRGGDGGAPQNPSNPNSYKPTDPDAPWTTNWNSMLAVGGSGLEAMGQTDPRASAGTVGAFLAMQDIYRAAPSTQRDVAAVLANSWWVKQLTGNTITVTIGASAKQFLKLVDGTFITPGDFAVLVQTNNRVINTSPCGLRPSPYPLTRGWDYSGATNSQPVSFTVTGAHGDVQSFPYWMNQVMDGKMCTLINGFRLTTWTFPQGGSASVNYAPLYPHAADLIQSVTNSFGRQINFVNPNGDSVGTGFNNNLSGADARSVSFSTNLYASNGTDYTFTDQNGAQTLVETIDVPWAYSIDRFLLHLVYTADNPAQGLTGTNAIPTNPASLEYDYDTLRRVMDAKDGDALQLGSHQPYYFFVGDHVRGEREDPAGASYAVEYDIYKQPYEVFDEIGRETVLQHDARERVTSYTYPEGNQEQYIYDDRGNTTTLTKVATPGSGLANIVLSATWDPTWNKPLTIVDGAGNTTTFTYYASGATGASLMNTATRPADVDGNHPVYSFSYNSLGEPLTATDPTGLVTQNTYDGTYGNLLTTAIDPAHVNSVTTYTYDANGEVLSVSDPLSHVTNFTYDLDGRKVFDIKPNPTTTFSPSLLRPATRSVYDALGRVIEADKGRTTSATGSDFAVLEATTSTFDPDSKVIQTNVLNGTATPALAVTQFSYDGDDRLTYTAVRMNPAVYGSLPGNASTLSTVANGIYDRITQLNYDAAGEKTSEVRAYATAQQITYGIYAYGLDGELASSKDANGNLTTLVPDGFQRLSQLRFPSTSRGSGTSDAGDVESYAYDSNDNRVQLTKRDGSTVIDTCYDALNRSIKKLIRSTSTNVTPTQCSGVTTGAATDVFTDFDQAGRPTHARYVSRTGSGVDFGYDTAGRLTTETTFGRTMSNTYDLAGNRTGLTWPDTLYYGVAFDAVNRMWWEGNSSVAVGFAYDDVGREIEVLRDTPPKTYFQYDNADRLTNLAENFNNTSANQTWAFTYSPASQKLSRSSSNAMFDWVPPPPASVNKTYDGLNRDATFAAIGTQPCAASGSGYDCNGNLTSDGTRTFTYDAENRLLSASGPTAISLAYDPLGRLWQTTAGGAVTQFLYSGQNLAAEYDGSGHVLRRYVPGPGSDDAQVWAEGADWSSPHYLHKDAQGSVIAWSDAGGNVAAGQVYAYGAYGEPQAWGGSRFRYTGQIELPEAQLYYYKARAYDPASGRFLQTDPIGGKDNLDLYEYVNDDPVDNADPLGLDTEVFLLGYIMGSAPVQGQFGHSFVELQDTNSNRSVIIRAGPGPGADGQFHPISSVAGATNGRTGDRLLAGMDNALTSIDTAVATQRGYALIPLASTTLKTSFDDMVAEGQEGVDRTNGQNIEYRSQSTNSNMFSFHEYGSLTGRTPPADHRFPGSGTPTPSSSPAKSGGQGAAPSRGTGLSPGGSQDGCTGSRLGACY